MFNAHDWQQACPQCHCTRIIDSPNNPTCVTEALLNEKNDSTNLLNFWILRRVLIEKNTFTSRRIVDVYYKHNSAVKELCDTNPTIKNDALITLSVVAKYLPSLILNIGETRISQSDVLSVNNFLNKICELKGEKSNFTVDIEQVRAEVNLFSMIGLSPREALNCLK